MREIKFRAWDKQSHIWLDNDEYVIKPDSGAVAEIDYSDGYVVIAADNHDAVLEQYAGLKDKNGVEIYEGDVVKLYSETHDIFGFEITKQQTGRIYFVDGAFFISGGTGDDPIYAYEDELEVIGNIHENADLLEEQ